MKKWTNNFNRNPRYNTLQEQRAVKEVQDLLSFQTRAQTCGVDIVCKTCKEPLWNVVVDLKNDPTGTTRKITSHKDIPEHDTWWNEETKSYKPDCPKCGKSFMNAVPLGKDEQGQLIVMHKPVVI